MPWRGSWSEKTHCRLIDVRRGLLRRQLYSMDRMAFNSPAQKMGIGSNSTPVDIVCFGTFSEHEIRKNKPHARAVHRASCLSRRDSIASHRVRSVRFLHP